jgi:hypothetical protein
MFLLSLQAFIWSSLGYFLFTQYNQLISLKNQLDALEQSTNEIVKDHPVLIHADLVFAEQIRDITRQLVSMDNQLQGLENKRDNDGGYQHALRILEMGGDRNEIVESCHLSNAEAELLMNLQAYRAAMGVQQPV